jgi:hypothetical protein
MLVVASAPASAPCAELAPAGHDGDGTLGSAALANYRQDNL